MAADLSRPDGAADYVEDLESLRQTMDELATRAREAQRLLDSDPSKAEEILKEIQTTAQTGLNTLDR